MKVTLNSIFPVCSAPSSTSEDRLTVVMELSSFIRTGQSIGLFSEAFRDILDKESGIERQRRGRTNGAWRDRALRRKLRAHSLPRTHEEPKT